MPRDPRTGRAWQALLTQCKASHPWTCHLCGQAIPHTPLPQGHPLEYQADHVITVNAEPQLAMRLTNLRPSHGRCNRYRGNRPLTPALIAEITVKYATRKPALDFFKGRGAVTERHEGPSSAGPPPGAFSP